MSALHVVKGDAQDVCGQELGPYADAAGLYVERGWAPLPLPAGKKSPPPDGFTGSRGRCPTAAEVAQWEQAAPSNIAIRLPGDVVGIDVDTYEDKTGADELAKLEAELGQLPPTWSSTSRGTVAGPGLSRILLFRVPNSTRLRAQVAPSIEAIQRHHRYAVVAPSINPKTGTAYLWYDDAGEAAEHPPYVDDLAELPWQWIDHLRSVGGGDTAEAAAPERVAAFLIEHTDNDHPGKLQGIRNRLADWRPGQGRHDLALAVACWMTREAAAGFFPAAEGLNVLEEWWRRVIPDAARRDGTELGDILAWAIAQVDAGPERIAEIRAGDTDDEGDPKRAKKSQATELIELAHDRYDLGVSDTGTAYAVDRQGPNVALSLRGGSGAIGPKVSAAYYERHHRAPTSAARADALSVLEGEALQAEAIELPLRVGRSDQGRIVLDLGRAGGTAVELRPGRWEILDRSPFVFRRTDLTNELPLPGDNGDEQILDLLRDTLNVTPRDWPLVVGWLVALLIPDIPHPVLALFGEQGTGKSTAGKMLGQVIDPTGAPLRSAPRHEDAWATNASGSWVVVLDNISSIQPWLSDALCRAVTGDGWVRRRLYTDGDPAVTRFRRCIVMTSIDSGALRGDLAERLLPIELERIDPVQRRTEAEVDEAFRSAHAAILGGLLDLTAKVLERLPHIELAELPRMADFARVLAAADEVTGWNSLETFLGIGAELAEDVIEADPVAQAVVDLIDAEGQWSGTSAQLLRRLTPEGAIPKNWPTSPQAIGGQVKRAAVALRQVGVIADKGEGRARRTWFLGRVSAVGDAASPSSPSSPPNSGCDDGDKRDDLPPNAHTWPDGPVIDDDADDELSWV